MAVRPASARPSPPGPRAAGRRAAPAAAARRPRRAAASAVDAGEVASILGVAGLAYVGWSTWVYSKVTFAQARLIGQRVPSGARCVELNADSKNLYYYPKVMEIVTAVGNTGDKLSEKQYQFDDASSKTGVPVLCVDDEPEKLRSVKTGSCDAVVSSSAMAISREPEKVLDEVFRVLKPDGVFVFVEMLNGSAKANLELLKARPEVTSLSVDPEFLDGAKPHAVGWCAKSVNTTDAEEKLRGGAKRSKPKKGFS